MFYMSFASPHLEQTKFMIDWVEMPTHFSRTFCYQSRQIPMSSTLIFSESVTARNNCDIFCMFWGYQINSYHLCKPTHFVGGELLVYSSFHQCSRFSLFSKINLALSEFHFVCQNIRQQ